MAPNLQRQTYATIDQLNAKMNSGKQDSSMTLQAKFAKLCNATSQINRLCHRSFEPMYETRYFNWVDYQRIMLNYNDLLQLVSVVDGQGTTLPLNALIPMGGRSQSATATVGPYSYVLIDIAKGSLLTYGITKERSIAVTAWWGYHEDYANAWASSGDTLTTAITVNTGLTPLTLNVASTSPTATDAWGNAPRFSIGNLIQIDQELFRVIQIPSATTLLVQSGANGSIPTTHLLNAPINVFQQTYTISDATTRTAGMLIAQDAAPYMETVMPQMGTIVKLPPGSLPSDVIESLSYLIVSRVS